MGNKLFTEDDLRRMQAKGIAPETALAQIETFKKGIPSLRLKRPCTPGDGILEIPEDQHSTLRRRFRTAAAQGRVMKFVPASGAATRMFKALHSAGSRLSAGEVLNLDDAGDQDFLAVKKFRMNIDRFAFYETLREVIKQNRLELETLLAISEIKPILDFLLTPAGLNYGQLPKGMIPFHRYPQETRTAFEEHLAEAAAYARDGQGTCRVHFTIASPLKDEILNHLEQARPRFEAEGNQLAISYSFQQSSTDTLAVNADNTPFRDHRGRLLFRPAGHGALLANLSQLQGDIVFIKNIDNVVPDRLKKETTYYKEVLGGLLITYQKRIHTYLQQLRGQLASSADTEAMLIFAREQLNIIPPDQIRQGSSRDKVTYLQRQLDRPIRVCGMVRNVGEPGGGPFWVEHADGAATPQIVEAASVDLNAADQRAHWQAATHFNPVDVVCGLRDYQQQPFELSRYTDPESGFISKKSKDGKELKALELPGLWNGSMANWITIFAEVPTITFNPVKTVFDLLRPEHQ
jgi:hypothetical protein